MKGAAVLSTVVVSLFLSIVSGADFLQGVRADNLEVLEITHAIACQDTVGYGEYGSSEFFDLVGTISYSPDRKYLAYVRIDGRHLNGVWVKEADGHSDSRLIEGGFNPHWSPRGDLIACMRRRVVGELPDGSPYYGRIELSVTDPTGKNTRVLAPGLFCHLYSWSPDGRFIAACVDGAGFGKDTSVLLAIDVATGGQVVLDSIVHPELGIQSFSWAPNSRMLAYVLFTDIQQEGPELMVEDIKDSEVFIINQDGTGRTRLTDTPEVEEYVRWSSDGKRLLVCDVDEALGTVILKQKRIGGRSCGQLRSWSRRALPPSGG